ncbi:MAG: DUF1844 domain-containing protein [Ignavibacteria bacterium]
MDSKEKNTQLFMYLAGSFEMSAMMAMGKIKNPMTDKTEKDMTQAQFSIDLLDMLKEKTAGNLSDYEAKFLENLTGQLKLNYLDEAKKEESANKVSQETVAEKSAEPDKNTAAENITESEKSE